MNRYKWMSPAIWFVIMHMGTVAEYFWPCGVGVVSAEIIVLSLWLSFLLGFMTGWEDADYRTHSTQYKQN